MVVPSSTLTLFTALLLAFAAPAAANVPSSSGLVNRGEHQRMIKRYNSPLNKRLLEGIFGPPADSGAINAAPDPNGNTDADDDTPVQNPANSQSTPTPTPNRPGGGGGLGDIIGGALGGGASDASGSSTTPTVTETTPTETVTTPTETKTTPPPVTHTTPPPTTTPTESVTEATSIVFAGTPEEQAEQTIKQQEKKSRIPPHVVTILIIVGSSIGGLALIWTLVRKWKFRASRSFQDRLAPIDWQPSAKKDDSLAPPMLENDNASIRRNMFAPDDASSLAPPAHDFTAVPGGYRSASPMPNPYARTASPAPMALYRAPSNGSGRAYDPARGY